MTSAAVTPLVDGDATLRGLAAVDLETTRAWRNHPESRVWFHTTDEIAADQHAAWFRRYLSRDDDYVLILEVGGTPVAQAAFSEVRDGSAEFGRMLVDPEARGRGLSHRMIALCLRFATEALGLREIRLEVKPDNVRAIRAYEAAGFRADEARAGTEGSWVMVRRVP